MTLNTRTGSRTIVHFRDLPEFQATDLAAAPVEQVDWVHLEARDGAATARMLVALRARLVDQPVSLEVEKDRPGVDELLPRPDVLLCSRPFARGRGFDSAPGFLEYMGRIARRQILVCTWGEAGAWARDPAGALYHAPAMSPSRIVDTLGAGDTFNAGFIHAMASGRNVPEALDLAVQLAGHKVGQYGLDGPGEVT